ncbi:MAG: hypothetical protein E7638_07990 [Ruminococcaceae bacterium]|nr:hypothetical protein [Oscillospiraceae bacterium]
MPQQPMEKGRCSEVSMGELSPLIREIVASGGKAELTVTGNSMYPMMKHRVSMVRLCAPHEPKVGDIPLYQRNDGVYVLHRIVGMDEDGYICCGDNQCRLEKGIRREQIIAVVDEFKRTKRWRSCRSLPYRAYAWCRRVLRPMRRLVRAGMRRLRRIFGK